MGKYFEKGRSLATGVLTAGHGGGVIGPTSEAIVRITVSWQTTYRIMAGVAFILCSLAVTFDPNIESDEDDNDNQEKEERHGDDKAIEEIATRKQLIYFSVWKELPVIAIIVGARVAEFGHLLMHRLFCARSRRHVRVIEATFHVRRTINCQDNDIYRVTGYSYR